MRLKLPEVEDANLNLIPIMNLFTALIPFLLLSAAFYHMAIIKVTVPVASSSGETDVAKDEDKITLTLRILPTAFDVTAASDTVDPKVVRALAAQIPRTIDENDKEATKATYAALSDHAFAVKSRFSASTTVVVVPDATIPFNEVVGAVDALRQTVRIIDGNRTLVELFPKVVLSSVVK